MRTRFISRATAITILIAGLMLTSGCTSTGCASAAPQLTAATSGCDSGSGHSAPTPGAHAANALADCTRDFEGPDNTPTGHVTAWVSFTCPFKVESATLTISIWHSGGGGSGIGDKPEASHTCFELSATPCTVTVKCTEGPYRAAFVLSALVNGTHVPDADQSSTVTYSAGDCTV